MFTCQILAGLDPPGAWCCVHSAAGAPSKGMELATQWGRESSFEPGRRQGSAGPIIVVAILSLALGFAGGYGVFRYVQPTLLTQQDTSAPRDDASTEIIGLNEALDAAMKDLDAARAAQSASAAEVESLKAQTARQAADLDAMAEKLAAVSNETRPPEDEAKFLGELNRERDALSAENAVLKENLAALEAERDSLRQKAVEAEERLSAELTRLTDQVLPELIEERDQLQGRVLTLLADRDALKAEVEASAGNNTADVRRILELEAQLAETARDLATTREALAERATERSESAAAPDAQVDPDVSAQSAVADTPGTVELSPRDSDAVAAALRTAPGLGFLSTEDRRRLSDSLTAGECVTTALEEVFDRVPILTLRNLIRDLNSDC